MDMREYQALAQRTSNAKTRSAKMENGCLGLAGESGEVCDLLKKYLFQGHELNTERMIEEVGDVLWYCAELAEALGVGLDEIAERNIEKLRKRYPRGFEKGRSVNRDD